MEYTFDVTVTQRDADLALGRFLLREAGIGTFVAISLCVAFVGWDFAKAGGSYLSAVLGTLIGMLFFLYAGIFIMRRRQMKVLLRRLGGSSVSYHLGEDEIATKTILGSSSLKWELVSKLWIDPDLVLVIYSGNAYTTIPTRQIPKEALDFFKSKVLAIPGVVVDRLPSGEIAR